MIKIIKLVHSLIWLIMALASIYILYAGITNTFNSILLVCIILLISEILILVYYKWSCPLTFIAERYTQDRNSNFDIYLPNWLAKYNKIIFWIIFVIGIVLVIFNFINLR